jgi:hypothetical protein
VPRKRFPVPQSLRISRKDALSSKADLQTVPIDKSRNKLLLIVFH